MGEILKLIGTFVRSIEYLVAGTPNEDGLIQAFNEPRERFKKEVRQTAPDFRPLERPRSVSDSNWLALTSPDLPLPKPSFLSNEEPESEWQPDDDSRAIFVEEVMKKASS